MTKIKKKDRIVFLVLAGIGAVLALAVLIGSRGGARVTVRVDGEVYGSYSLLRDREVRITGSDGEENVLIIRNGSAWMESASCPDGLCVRMGKISRKGQSVICLPNRVSVEITGESTEEEDGDAIDITVR